MSELKTMHQLKTLQPKFFEAQRSQGYRIESPFLKQGFFIMSFTTPYPRIPLL